MCIHVTSSEHFIRIFDAFTMLYDVSVNVFLTLGDII
jgi:hypothetical protein